MAQASPYVPGAIQGRIPPRLPAGTVEIVFAAADDAERAARRVRQLRQEAADLAEARRYRLEDLLARSHIATGIPRDDHALAWARISLDNLIMAQRGVGIYAGFYWFTTYWGRDSFITLPGACLVNGDFGTAETILRSFAEFQDRDPASAREGRLPNFVTVEQVQFAGVDGTWWFARAVDELWRRSGRNDFACEMAPVVIRAVEGALRHAVDPDGFLTHGDGETWMDAGGEANPYSPRSDRAVEVQALWHRGLLAAARLAERCDPDAELSSDLSGAGLAIRYRERATTLASSFHRRFWQDGRLVDHLDRDGTPDRQVRPNGLLAVLASPSLFSEEQRRRVVEPAAQHLVRPWGVLSLAGDDPAFHPRHLDLASYYYDEAYHNGDIWLWLSGAYISALPSACEGFSQTRMLLDEILDEGAVGTLQEIRDGARAECNDEFGGATSQAWSLAELIRTVVDNYLGLAVDLTATPPELTISPSLPEAWPSLDVRTRVGDYNCRVHCRLDRRNQCNPAEGTGPETLADRAELDSRATEHLQVYLLSERPLPEDWVVSVGLGGQILTENCNTPANRQHDPQAEWPFVLAISVGGAD
jgi:glycogen debranching enzyme